MDGRWSWAVRWYGAATRYRRMVPFGSRPAATRLEPKFGADRSAIRGLGGVPCSLVECVLRPVLGVGLGVLAHPPAVDRVDLHEATHGRRLVGAVQQDAPHRT